MNLDVFTTEVQALLLGIAIGRYLSGDAGLLSRLLDLVGRRGAATSEHREG